MLWRLWTIGHSTLSLERFASLLENRGIRLLCDVRAVASSSGTHSSLGMRLARSLPERGIDYRHLAGVGGRRHAQRDSPNTGWENAAFRGYADYALSPEFANAFRELCGLAGEQCTAIMCAEALWWRCHRRLISDRLLVAGWEVSISVRMDDQRPIG